MKVWPVQDAKARFSEFLDASVTEGPQIVSRRGVEISVLVPIAEWRRLTGDARPSAKDLLLSDERRFELDIPKRGQIKHRPPLNFR